MKTKRLSIFDLKEGKVYRAFDGDREIGRRFRIVGGVLQNNAGSTDIKQYVGCSYVPVNANISFEEEGDSDQQVSLLALHEGTVYESNKTGRIARKGSTLFIVNGENKMTTKLPLSNIPLNNLFMAVGKVAQALKAKKAAKSGKSSKKTRRTAARR